MDKLRADAAKQIRGIITEYEKEKLAKPDGSMIGNAKAEELMLRGKTAVDRVCPPGNHYRQQSDGLLASAAKPAKATASWLRSDWEVIFYMVNLLQALERDLNEGHLDSIWDSARAETCADVVEQAALLHQGGFLAAAAVLAGGALEARLRQFCDRLSLAVPPPGGISKYDAALATARKAGGIAVPYDGTKAHQIGGWGALRNEAAHDPEKFVKQHSAQAVEAMIIGVRDFLAQVR